MPCYALQNSNFRSAARLSHSPTWDLAVNQSTGHLLSILMLQNPMPREYSFSIHITVYATLRQT